MARWLQHAVPPQSTTTRPDLAAIEKLPNELVRCIVNRLELEDVCSLRQTCRFLARSGAAGPFEDAIKRRRLILSEDGLHHFIEGLGIFPQMQQVQDLTIWATYDDIEIKLIDEDGDWSMPDATAHHIAQWQWKKSAKVVTMLHEVIEHLARQSDRRIHRIELVAEPHPSWERLIVGNRIMPRVDEHYSLSPLDAAVWGQQQQQTVEMMFVMVRGALQHAETSCVHFVLFTAVRGCNLDYSSWTDWLHSTDSEIVLRQTKTVGLRVKTPDESRRNRSDLGSSTADLPRLQQIARQLQTYHVHWFTLPHDTPHIANDHILRRLSSSSPPPSQLTSCTLQGIVSQDRDLLALFQHNLGLQELRLERPRILLGRFTVKDIFDCIRTKLKHLHFLAISGMRANGLVLFNSPAPLLPWQTDQVYWISGTAAVGTRENLVRCGELAHAPFAWTLQQEYTHGCLHTMTTHEAMAREFGR